jgi:NAD(P)H-quinone oxidoreductase subunit 5
MEVCMSASVLVPALPLSSSSSLPLWQAALLILPLLSLAGAALLARAQANPAPVWRLARAAATLALGAAALSLLAVLVAGSGKVFVLRADLVGGVMLLLVTFIGWAILRYSQPYLDGERNETGYISALLAALAAVVLVVISNHLLVLVAAWTATSLALRKLLTFFHERPAAVLAAHKKFIAGRVADVAMLAAAALLYVAFGTLQIDAIAALELAPGAAPAVAQAAMLLIALAALLKCAQLPSHGWLIQVMEAPTPVSALLHAGIVNLGGFMLIRFAPLLAEVPLGQWLLVLVGAGTAIAAALVMTTRVSIKVALAWSTCAQMGFMLMQVGLGLYEMALLHIVAHSLYKAHAFLSAGTVVRQTSVRKLATATAPASIGTSLVGAAFGLAMVAAAAWLWTALPGLKGSLSPALVVAAGIVALALTPMLQPRGALALRPAAAAFGVALAYFGLHTVFAGWVAPAALPPAPLALALLAALAFVALFIVQCAVTSNPTGALARRLYPWFYGGFFLDERVSRAVFRLVPPPTVRDAGAAPARLAQNTDLNANPNANQSAAVAPAGAAE